MDVVISSVYKLCCFYAIEHFVLQIQVQLDGFEGHSTSSSSDTLKTVLQERENVLKAEIKLLNEELKDSGSYFVILPVNNLL